MGWVEAIEGEAQPGWDMSSTWKLKQATDQGRLGDQDMYEDLAGSDRFPCNRLGNLHVNRLGLEL
jgi:hypothetical protein